MLGFLMQSSWADQIGWMLVHSLWQFALVALLAFVVQLALQRRSAIARYRALLAAMFVMVAVPITTCWLLWSADTAVVSENVPLWDAPLQSMNESPSITASSTESPIEITAEQQPVPEHLQPPTIDRTVSWLWVKASIESWLPEIVLVWLIGLMLATSRLFISYYTIHRLKTTGISPVGNAVQNLLESTIKRLGFSRAVKVLQSTLVKTPVVVGYLRPAILLPLCVVTGMPEPQLELILAHELAHIRRHDYLVNLLQVLVETLFFYHPAVWWLSRQIRNERENCCDDVAMATVGSRADYGRALLAIEELRAAPNSLLLAARGGSLLARMRRIAGCEPAPRVADSGSILCAILAAIAIFAAVTWAAAPDSTEKHAVVETQDTALPFGEYLKRNMPADSSPFIMATVPGRMLLSERWVQAELKITDEQKKRLADIVDKFLVEQRRFMPPIRSIQYIRAKGKEPSTIDSSTTTELQQGSSKLNHDTCKQMDDVLTSEQLYMLENMDLCLNAFSILFERRVLEKLNIGKQEQGELIRRTAQVMNEMQQKCNHTSREINEKAIAILTPQQRIRLQEEVLRPGSESLGMFHVADLAGVTLPARYPPIPYPNLTSDKVANRLDLNAVQRDQIREILEEFKPRQDEVFHQWDELSKESATSLIDQRQKRLTVSKNSRHLVAELRKQLETVLTRKQLAAYKEMAVCSVALNVLHDERTLWKVGVNRQQNVVLRQLEQEASEKPKRIIMEMAETVLRSFTPAQRRMLQEEVELAQKGEQGKTVAEQGSRPPSRPHKIASTESPPALLTAFGKVLDLNGNLVAGATVYLREWSTYRISSDPYNRDVNDILATTKTDAQGEFRFEDVAARPMSEQWLRQIPWDVVVVARPYAMAWRHLEATEQSEPLTITLVPEVKITGCVNDQQGRPVRDAEVRVNSISPLGSDYPCHAYADPEVLDLQRSRLAPVAKTGVGGKVTIHGLPRDERLRLGVTHDDFRGDFVLVATTDKSQPNIEYSRYSYADRKSTKQSKKIFSSDFSIALKPPLPRLIGRVTAADSKKPLPKIKVEQYGSTGSMTGPDGRFVVKNIRGERFRLLVWVPKGGEYLGRVMFVDVPRDKKETQLDIELERGQIINGVVVDDKTGKGVAGVLVGLFTDFDLNTTTVDGLLPTSAQTNSEGRFRLAVPPGKGKVRIFGPVRGYDLPRPSGRPEDVEGFFKEIEVIAGKPTDEVKFTVSRMASDSEEKLTARRDDYITKARKTVYETIEGKIIDPDGKPAAGVEVGLAQWFRNPDGSEHPVMTDKDGRFSFKMGPRHNHSDIIIVAIDKKRKLRGHTWMAYVPLVATSKTPLQIRLGPTGVVTGRVLEGDKPIAGAYIQLNKMRTANEPGLGISYYIDGTTTDANGEFRFPYIEADMRFHLSVHAEKYANEEPRNDYVQVAAGETFAVRPFSFICLDKSVAGTVVDPDGNPVEGASVSAEMLSGGSIPRAFTPRPTGKDGRFTIHGVPDVPLTLMAYIRPPDDAEDRRIHFPARIEAEPGQTDVRIVLDPKLVRGKK